MNQNFPYHVFGRCRPGLTLCSFLLMLNACANEPGPVGSGLLPPSDLLRADTLLLPAIQSSSVTAVPDSFIAWSTVALGKTGAMEAWTVIRFDGFSQSLNNISVKKAEVRLNRAYHLGDSTTPMLFEVGRILADWRATNLTYQTVQEPGFFGTTSAPTQLSDDTTLTFNLDTAMVSSWFRADSANPNHGIILKPAGSSTLIRGYLIPQLYFTYTLPDSVTEDTATVSASLADFGFVFGSQDTSFLSDSVSMTLRAGAAYRGLMQFDISGLPGFSAIHRATLEVTSTGDTSNFSTAVQDSLLALFVDEGGFVETLEALGVPSTSGGVKTYSFNVTTMVQFWAQGLAVPRIGIRSLNERNAVDGFVLHGSAASTASVRPRLRITYSATRQ